MKNDSVSLLEFNSNPNVTNDERRKVFVKMDETMKNYVHSEGWFPYVFNPNVIKLGVDDNGDYVVDFGSAKRKVGARRNVVDHTAIKGDIYKSAVLHLLLYAGAGQDQSRFKYLSPEEVQKNVEKYAPVDDYEYYAGVIKSHSLESRNPENKYYPMVQKYQDMYFSDYAKQKDLELGASNTNDIHKVYTKKAGYMENSIYSPLRKDKEAAFINMLMIPVVLTFVVMFFALIYVVSTGL